MGRKRFEKSKFLSARTYRLPPRRPSSGGAKHGVSRGGRFTHAFYQGGERSEPGSIDAVDLLERHGDRLGGWNDWSSRGGRSSGAAMPWVPLNATTNWSSPDAAHHIPSPNVPCLTRSPAENSPSLATQGRGGDLHTSSAKLRALCLDICLVRRRTSSKISLSLRDGGAFPVAFGILSRAFSNCGHQVSKAPSSRAGSSPSPSNAALIDLITSKVEFLSATAP